VNSITRRRFLNRSLVSAGAAGASAAVARAATVSSLASVSTSILGANERVRFGIIGTGGQGRHDLMTFFKHDHRGLECPVICDVDDAMLDQAAEWLQKNGKNPPDRVKDFRRVCDRKDIDVVLVATPDHWHALQTIQCMQAGKDVYCEKPLANSIGEGKAMLDWAGKTGRVVQMGTQWRMSGHFREAVEQVQSGKLGRIRLVRCWAALGWFQSLGKVADSEVPAGVDYDMWLGPAPRRPFNRARFHFAFRWFYDYAGGLMTDWGVHLLNIALWAMNASAPKRVASTGGKYIYPDDTAETPDTQCTLYDFEKFTLVWEHQAGTGHGPEHREHGCAFYGTNGTLVVDGSGYDIYPEGQTPVPALKKKIEEDPGLCRVKLVGDFLECCRTRRKPAEDIELGHWVTTVAHLGNLALRTGRSIEYDVQNMKVIGNDQANAMITNPYRRPWELPKA